MATAVKAKRTRKVKTSADLKSDLAEARVALAVQELRAYACELDEHVKNSAIIKEFKAIREKVKNATDVGILTSIGKAAGIKRLAITIKPATTRKPKEKK